MLKYIVINGFLIINGILICLSPWEYNSSRLNMISLFTAVMVPLFTLLILLFKKNSLRIRIFRYGINTLAVILLIFTGLISYMQVQFYNIREVKEYISPEGVVISVYKKRIFKSYIYPFYRERGGIRRELIMDNDELFYYYNVYLTSQNMRVQWSEKSLVFFWTDREGYEKSYEVFWQAE